MHNSPERVKEAKEKLNKISPSFCIAKWKHSTIHLHLGSTHSCYLPPTHKIETENILKNPSGLHNTPQKKTARAQMLKGERPSECKTCWEIEDLGSESYSERHYRGQDIWAKPFYEEVGKINADEDINPSYLEVSFNSSCNFKCSYCKPTFSTSWLKEVQKYGGYELIGTPSYLSEKDLRAADMLPDASSESLYLQAFKKWWPELKSDLMFLRITGGEPLLSRAAFEIMEDIAVNPLPRLELSINTNLGTSDESFERFLKIAKQLILKGAIKHLSIHTSVDSFGAQAEYIRHGLVFEKFAQRCERLLAELPQVSLCITCTYNVLSITGFRDLIDWVTSLRNQYEVDEKKVISVDIPHLQGPLHQSCLIVNDNLLSVIESDVEYLNERSQNKSLVRRSEFLKLERVYYWICQNRLTAEELSKNRRNFFLFFREHDLRRGVKLESIFPKNLVDFYLSCDLGN